MPARHPSGATDVCSTRHQGPLSVRTDSAPPLQHIWAGAGVLPHHQSLPGSGASLCLGRVLHQEIVVQRGCCHGVRHPCAGRPRPRAPLQLPVQGQPTHGLTRVRYSLAAVQHARSWSAWPSNVCARDSISCEVALQLRLQGPGWLGALQAAPEQKLPALHHLTGQDLGSAACCRPPPKAGPCMSARPMSSWRLQHCAVSQAGSPCELHQDGVHVHAHLACGPKSSRACRTRCSCATGARGTGR